MLGSAEEYRNIALTGILSYKNLNVNSNMASGDKHNFIINCAAPRGISGGLLIDQKGLAIGMMQSGVDPFGFAISIGSILNRITEFIKMGYLLTEEQLAYLYKREGILPDLKSKSVAYITATAAE